MSLRKIFHASAIALGVAGVAAQAILPAFAQNTVPTLPVVQAVNPGDYFQDIPNGYPTVGNQYATPAQLGIMAAPPKVNVIIGGDGTTNLWQRGTAGTSTTSSTPVFDSADRWAQWSASSAGVKIARGSTAADLPSGYLYDIALTHTNTTGGQLCMGQTVLSANSYGLAGQTVELDFHAGLGAGYSGGSLTATIATGTVANEGMTAFAGGTWTGYAAASAAVIPLAATANGPRYAVIAELPTNTAEIGVSFCYTAGTTDTNDYIAFDGVQLVRNPAMLPFVNTTLGYALATPPSGMAATPFVRRDQATESNLQYAYYYQVTETGSSSGSDEYSRGLCRSRSTTTCSWDVKFPVPMNQAATVTLANGFAVETTVAGGTLNVCTLTNDTTVSAALASTTDAYVLCTASTVPAAGTVDQVYDDGGTGKVKASAEY